MDVEARGDGTMLALRDSATFTRQFDAGAIWDGTSYRNGWSDDGGVELSRNADGSLRLVNTTDTGNAVLNGTASTADGGATTWNTANGGDWTVEIRLRFDDIAAGFALWLGTGDDLILVEIHARATRSTTFEAEHGDNEDGAFHDYRVAHVRAAGAYHVWRDGIRLTPSAGAGYNSTRDDPRLLFGDYTRGSFGDGYRVDIRHVRYDTTGAWSPPVATALRGDGNGDGAVDISDAVFVLLALFDGGEPIACADAADTNHDGALDVSDAIALLGFLFMGGPPPTPTNADC